jgi:carboxyl-terminal processing protease
MDRRATVLSIVMPPMMVACFVVGYFFPGRRASAQPGDPSSKVKEVQEKIDTYFYGSVKPEEIEKAAVTGIVAKLDPYCEYFTAADWVDFDEMHMKGNFGGVGILIEGDASGYLRVQTPIEGSPAFAAGILPGDLIVAVEGQDIQGLPQNDVIKRIKGPEGTKVTLTIARKNVEPFKVTLTRAKIRIQAVTDKMLEDGVGYIRISDFTEMIGQFDAAVERLKGKGMKALIVDLRGNGGGLLSECVKLSDRFLPKGKPIVSTRSKAGELDNRVSEDDTKDVGGEIPLAILVNGGTASASEIFAGAMMDHERGALVGSRTYGKGSVQTPFELSDKSRLKLTTARYFTPSGRSVHREEGKREYGLDPHYLVELTDEENLNVQRGWSEERVVKGVGGDVPPSRVTPGFVDLQLKAALEVVAAKLAKREPKVEKRELSSIKKKN